MKKRTYYYKSIVVCRQKKRGTHMKRVKEKRNKYNTKDVQKARCCCKKNAYMSNAHGSNSRM